MERFADEIELAQFRIDQITEIALAALRGASGIASGRKTCVDCGERIPEPRLTHVPSAVRCVPCQDRVERRTGGK